MAETEDKNSPEDSLEHCGRTNVQEICEQGIFELNNGKDLVIPRE